MEIERNYKRDAYFNLGFFLVVVGLKLWGINIFTDGVPPIVWIGAGIGVFIGGLIKKDKQGIFEIMPLIIIIVLNYYILFRNNIYIPNFIIAYLYWAVLTIYYLTKSSLKWKNFKIAAVIGLLTVAFLGNYYMYTTRIIKDTSLDMFVRRQLGTWGRVTEEELKGIDMLFINDRINIISLEGIQHLENLKRLEISDRNLATRDISPVSELNNLRRLTLWYMSLDKIAIIGQMPYLEELELLYNKEGELSSLENFPNLKSVWVQGIDLENLNGLKGPNELESLIIAYGSVDSFDGIEELTNLKEIRLTNVDIEDISKIFYIKKLERVVFSRVNVANPEDFENRLREMGIVVEKDNPDIYQ